jgi:hypothetical protein
MISEQTAAHTSRQALPLHAFGSTAISAEVTDVQTTAWRKRLQTVARHASTLTMALLGALSSSVHPSYFDLEQLGPTHQRLGPGLSRESDSFWPLSEW